MSTSAPRGWSARTELVMAAKPRAKDTAMSEDPPVGTFADCFTDAVLRHFVATGSPCKPRDAAMIMERSLAFVKRELARLSPREIAILTESTTQVRNPSRKGHVYYPSRQALRRELIKCKAGRTLP